MTGWLTLAAVAAALVAARWRLPGRAAAAALMLCWTAWWVEVLARGLLADRVATTSSDHSANAWTVTDHGLPALERLPLPTALLSLDGRRPERQPGTWRVLFLGDSFTAGEGVGPGEDTPSRVAAALPAGPLTPEVLNHGVSGMSVWDEAALWDAYSQWWQPDVVVWMYVLNDLGAASPGNAVRDAGHAGGFNDGVVDRTRDGRPPGPSVAVDLVRLALHQRETTRLVEAAYRDGHDPTLAAEALAALTETWRRVGEPLRARGGRLIIAVWPLLHQLDAYPFTAAHAALRDAATAADAELVDLLPVFEGRDAAALWASPTDHHPNAAGHALAAAAVRDALLAGPVRAASPVVCPPADLPPAALCAAPSDPALHLAAAAWRARVGQADARSPFNPRPLIAVHLHQAAALTAPDDPRRADIAAAAGALVGR
jgi:lysophospholipase L1-like esterase